MINISLRVTSMPDLNAWADAIQLGAEDAAPAIAEVLREHADSCFENERSPWGEAWAPLKPATIAQRERIGKAGKILQRDGVLRRSVFASPSGRSSGVVDAEVGAGGPAAAYAMVHQHGGEHTPARPYLPIRPDGTVDLPAELDAEVQATIRDAIDARMEVAMRQDIAAEE